MSVTTICLQYCDTPDFASIVGRLLPQVVGFFPVLLAYVFICKLNVPVAARFDCQVRNRF